MSEGGGDGYAVGIDLGGTKVEAALIDGRGKSVSELRYQTRAERGEQNIVSELLAAIETLQAEAGVSAGAVGVGVAGQVDSSGTVLSAPNLPFNNMALQKRLASKTSLPVIVTNDVRAATFGEWRFGAGKGVDTLVVIFVGTGVGGGVVSGGSLLEGCGNTAGELGHVTLVYGGRKCRCPNSGCLEAYVGGWAIAERAEKAGLGNVSAETVAAACHSGDSVAARLVEETADYLASGVVGVVNIFNPCKVVLGGGVIEGLPEMIPVVEGVVSRDALKSNLKNLQIVRAGLGGKAGVIGAAALAREIVGGVR